MDLDLIKKLVKIVDTSGVTELEVQEGELKIKIGKNSHSKIVIPQQNVPSVQVSNEAPPLKTEPEQKPIVEQIPSSNLIEVRSPIVGTFYSSPAPDAEPYC
jgi:acetyl-CoA carboxylase biotin carboxyl carrier protein